MYNATEDAHPIHLHGVQFKVEDRQAFTAEQDSNTGALSDIEFIGEPQPPAAYERGWKDTVMAHAAVPSRLQNNKIHGMVTRIAMKFTLSGEYVWHCHILSHEDNEMMRPLLVARVSGAFCKQNNHDR